MQYTYRHTSKHMQPMQQAAASTVQTDLYRNYDIFNTFDLGQSWELSSKGTEPVVYNDHMMTRVVSVS